MEESEKRRERLNAMRMEAAQAGTHGGAENSMGPNFGHGLANPLIEAPPGVSEPYTRPRFDYYTDPMAAYSADKKRDKHILQVSQPYFSPPRPGYLDSSAYRAPGSYFLDPRLPQTHGVHHTFSTLGTPGPVQSSSSSWLPQNPPNVWGSSPGGSPSSNFPPNSSRFNNFTNHRYGRGSPSFGYGRGRGRNFSNSPRPGSYQDSGRGRGRWQGNNIVSRPSSMQSGGRGSGYSECSSAEARPDRYYNKSMVEDPWENLKPAIWKKVIKSPSKDVDTPGSQKSWLPSSISMKKARVSEGQVKSSPQQSLAEYLAASVNEAVDEGVNEESSA